MFNPNLPKLLQCLSVGTVATSSLQTTNRPVLALMKTTWTLWLRSINDQMPLLSQPTGDCWNAWSWKERDRTSPAQCLLINNLVLHYKKKWVVLPILVTSVPYPFPHDWTTSLAKHSPMTFTNVLESQIKFLIYVEFKAGSGTTLCLIMQTIKR